MLNPEILAEQVMGYTIGATEMIPTLEPTVQQHSAIIVPQGPHFYTGLLQAAGYLLLDNKKKKALIISEQYDDLKNILLDTNTYGPILGKTWKHSPKDILNLSKTFKAKPQNIYQTENFKNISIQLPFIRVIMEMEECVHISVGPKISDIQKKIVYTWIKNNITEYNIILLTNIEVSSEMKKKDEQKEIANILTNKKIKTSFLVKLFKDIQKITKQEAEIIAYVNPNDFGKKGSITTRYVCAVT